MAAQSTAESVKSQQVVDLQTTRAHVLYIKRRSCEILELEDTHFNFKSAVFIPPEKRKSAGPATTDNKYSDPELKKNLEKYHPLEAKRWYHGPYSPEYENAEPDDGSKKFDNLNNLAAVYRHAPGHKILIAGHTDTVGSDNANVQFSEARAKNVYYLLIGDRDQWHQSYCGRSKVEDYQCILTHFSERYHWDCHPGPIDNVHGSKTHLAVRNFQETYNSEFPTQQPIPVDGVVGEKTWKAMFDVYMRELSELLGGKDKLAAGRANLHFVGEESNNPTLACGERYPIEAQGQDNYKSKTNRRVEILFFDNEEAPAREAAEDLVYKRKVYAKKYITSESVLETGSEGENAGSGIVATELGPPANDLENYDGEAYQTVCDVFPEDEEDFWACLSPMGNTQPYMSEQSKSEEQYPV